MVDVILIGLFILMIFCLLGAGAAMLMHFRNIWVFEQIIFFHAEAFNRSADQWKELGCPTAADLAVSYDTMLWKFWIWDRERFRIKTLPPSDNGGLTPGRQLEILKRAERAWRDGAPKG